MRFPPRPPFPAAPDPSQSAPLAPPFLSLAEQLGEALVHGTLDDALRADLVAFDETLGAMRAQFRHETAHQDMTLDEEETAAEVLDTFHLVAECLSPLIEAAHRHDLDAMALEGPPLIAHLRTLSTLFERLREAELARPIESPIPAVNGVLRVARAVREERLSFDVLAARLRALLPALESAAAEGSGEEASALISAHHQAIEALLGCADSETLDGFDDAASRVRATAQALFDHAQATRASVDHAPAPPQELPDYAWALLTIADRLMAGEQCLDELRREASALRLRAEHGLATLHQLPQAPDDAPALEREACADAARIMEHGLSLVLDAVARFEATCQSGDADTLQDALDHLRAAIEEMRAMPLAFERLRPPP